ncbi:hypothetical protein ACROYT_G034599 [Oculina patagonica]
MTGMLDVDLYRASFPRVTDECQWREKTINITPVFFWLDSSVHRQGPENIKWICWSSTVAMNYKCVFKRRRRELSKELSDVPVLGSISKDLNLTQFLKEGQALILTWSPDKILSLY